MSDISERGSDFIRDLGNAARKNPLSAALIGMGVLWLFTGGRPVERAEDFVRRTGFDRIAGGTGADSIGEQVTSAKDALRDGGVDAFDSATRFRRDHADAASDYARSTPGAGAEMFDTARSNLTELFRTQPLALGAIGLAIGAGIAAALPSSEVETAYLGETSDTVKAKATEFAAEQTHRAKGVMGAVTEEARKEGLTLEGAKATVGDISAKVGRLVDAAGKGISERVASTKSL
jgi:hypothetical protein